MTKLYLFVYIICICLHISLFTFFQVVPIVNPRYRIDTNLKQRNSPFTRPDLLLGSSDWNSLIVGRISRHLNLESSDAKVRKDSENTLQTELNYATHLGKL